MSRPTFLQGVAVALLLSVVAALLFTLSSTLGGSSGLLRLLIAATVFVYLIYLLRRSRERVGRVSVLLLWSVVAAVTWFAEPPLLLYVTIHAGMIWLIRSLFFYSSIFASLADLGLNVLAIAAALWATLQAGSR